VAYIGNSPANTGNYQIVDSFSGFNGSTTTFALSAGGLAISPAKSGQILVAINGVLQEPDDSGTNGFKIVGSNIVFSSAPANGDESWAVYQGQNVDIGTPSLDTVGLAELSASGTASNTTFLRGDNAWAVVNTNLVADTSPQLGGNLDLNSNNITGTGGIPAANLTGNVAAARIASTAVPAANLTGNVASARLSSIPAGNLTGTVPAARLSTVATQAESDNSTKIATTAYVTAKITTLIGGAPSTLNDLNELAEAINDDANYNSTLTTALATKLPLAGGTMTGNLSFGTNTLFLSANGKIRLGGAQDLEIYHDGSNSYIDERGTGGLNVRSNTINLQKYTGETLASFQADGAVTLYHDNAIKFATTATGVTVAGNVNGLEITTAATSNIGLGTNAVNSITTGDYNVGLGDNAGTAISTGNNNLALGDSAMYQGVVTGNYNIAVGTSALRYLTSGSSNVAIGINSLEANTTASNNTAIGMSAMAVNTTGAENVALGKGALDANTTGAQNTGLGTGSLSDQTTGSNNVAVGRNSLGSNTTASNNTAIGHHSLVTNTTGSDCAAVGFQASYSNTTGIRNTSVGLNALYGVTTGSNNTAIGNGAGDNITTGGNNIIIGRNIDAASATADSQLNIGGWITGLAGNLQLSSNQKWITSKVYDLGTMAAAATVTISEGVNCNGAYELTVWNTDGNAYGHGLYTFTVGGYASTFTIQSAFVSHQGATDVPTVSIVRLSGCNWQVRVVNNDADSKDFHAAIRCIHSA